MREWMRVAGVPDYCNVSERTVRAWMKEGLRYSRIHGVILISLNLEKLESEVTSFVGYLY